MNESPAQPHDTQAAEHIAAVHASNKRKLVWGLVCLIGPTALIIVTLLLYAIVNFLFAINEMEGPAKTIMNVIMFLVGAVSVLTLFPGFVVGIILLATRTRNVPRQ